MSPVPWPKNAFEKVVAPVMWKGGRGGGEGGGEGRRESGEGGGGGRESLHIIL